jgi:O-methyltransferase
VTPLGFLKAPIRGLLRSLGYEIRPLNGAQPLSTLRYEQATPLATYAPWNEDAAFQDVYRRVQANTLVDRYRCYELWALVEQSKKLDGCLIEVGVWQGGTGGIIATQAQRCGIRDRVYLCDTFRGVVKATAKDSGYRGGEHADTSRITVERLIGSLGLTNVTILEGIFPDETGHLIKEPKCRFCHVDVDVYQSAADVVSWVWPRICVGGIVVYDDYGFEGCDGITAFVQEQVPAKDRLVFHNLNGHAVVVKIA